MKSLGLLLIGMLLSATSTLAAPPEDFSIRRDETPREYRARIVRAMAENARTETAPKLTSSNVLDFISQEFEGFEKDEVYNEALYAYADYIHGHPFELSDEMVNDVHRRLLLEIDMLRNPKKVYGFIDLELNLFAENAPHSSHWILEELQDRYPYPVLSNLECKELYEFYLNELSNVNERRIFYLFLKEHLSNNAWFKDILGEMMSQTADPSLAESALGLIRHFEDELVTPEMFRTVLNSATNHPKHRDIDGVMRDSPAVKYLRGFNALPQSYVEQVKAMIKDVRKEGKLDLLAGLKVLRYIVDNNTAGGGSRVCNILYSIQDKFMMRKF